ncbi:hypothetical protein AAC610_14600, partial [Neisseria gonorrhoeae]
SADAVLFLHDLTRQHTPGDLRIAMNYLAADAQIADAITGRLPANTPVIDVWNKSDMAGAEVLAAVSSGVLISAKTGAGLQQLRQQLLHVVGWQAAPEGVFMARERHVRALRQVEAQLARAAAQLHA